LLNQVTFRRLICGPSGGALQSALRGLLHVLSWPYGLAVGLRNTAFDRGWKPVCRISCPVISVGNITTGGTGKTPIVATIVRLLCESGLRPAILSRGYRSDQTGVNDEKRMLDQLCPGVPHAQNSDRVLAAQKLTSGQSPDVFVLDDGFQHRRLHRDLNLVLIDASCPFGEGFLLPRGLLREPLTSLRRADVVLITRADQATADQLTAIRGTILRYKPELQQRVFPVAFLPTSLILSDGRTMALAEFAGEPVFLLSGVGNPQAFAQSCRGAGLQIAGERHFADHHHYTESDLRQVRQLAQQAGARWLITTHKDLVKLPSHATDIAALQIESAFPDPDHAVRFRDLILPPFLSQSC